MPSPIDNTVPTSATSASLPKPAICCLRIAEISAARISMKTPSETSDQEYTRGDRSPSPPFRGEREGPVAQQGKGEVGGAANRYVGPPHLALSPRRAGGEGNRSAVGRNPAAPVETHNHQAMLFIASC